MYFSVMKGHMSDYVRAFLWGEIGYYTYELGSEPLDRIVSVE